LPRFQSFTKCAAKKPTKEKSNIIKLSTVKNCPDCNSGKSTTNGWSNRCRSKPALCRKCKDPHVPGNYIYIYTLLYINYT
jgi:hypothetical protein